MFSLQPLDIPLASSSMRDVDGTPMSTRDNAEAGRNVQERRLRLAMTVKDLAARAGVDRGRVAALEAGDPGVRQTTIRAIEAALTEVEQLTGVNAEDGLETIEFTIEGGAGVKVTVKGPVADREALRQDVSEIIRAMREDEVEVDPEAYEAVRGEVGPAIRARKRASGLDQSDEGADSPSAAG